MIEVAHTAKQNPAYRFAAGYLTLFFKEGYFFIQNAKCLFYYTIYRDSIILAALNYNHLLII